MNLDLTVGWFIILWDKVLLIHHTKLDLWLPVGWHIEYNETPDQALIREIKEETGIDIEILNQSDMPLDGNIKCNLALPFYTNIHNVWDHDHYWLFYICRPINSEQIKINKELKGFKWFTKEELNQEYIPIDVRNQALKAFDINNKIVNND